MDKVRIVGVVLVRNEDRFLGQALANVRDFCDSFLLFDHGSRDESPGILAGFAASHPDAQYRGIEYPGESQAALRRYCGTRTWVFGVDGDEVYDPAGLEALRPRLLAGEFDESWMVLGHCLHVDRLGNGLASGFAAPPSRSITKLYNFAALQSWEGASHERLHGGSPVFRGRVRDTDKRRLFAETSWEESPLRCLHLCFCPRSSLDRKHAPSRRNIAEIYGGRLPPALGRLAAPLLPSFWKRERYRRGNRFETPVQPFFPHGVV